MIDSDWPDAPEHVKLSLRAMRERVAMPDYKERIKLWKLEKEMVLTAIKHRQLPPVI
jgi:hypothetical protein